ncbi:DUF4251 domain-containing protein [Pedobacter sp. Leaf176]|uniref:DUF4251 domain-containing protein n=1 Tax=Pedobacter sp. Leaf176 TaxID=1736286 RepID=UPI0007012511|nr:DUF4251 domain-containing protein [Pedobacter sp. Leaf176]KQR69800.1 hypothetical protein ASF92_13910 [Pedobacter sp. Leaf176]
MKHLKLLSILFFALVAQAFSQTDKQTTAKIIADKSYIFTANTAMPMANQDVSQVLRNLPGSQGGGVINLSGAAYDFTVTPDSIVAYLPYYGRAFFAPYNPTEGGIKFKSKDFSYTQSKNKKGSYSVNIKTKDLKSENYQMVLTVSEKGYATLMVNSNNRQPINFSGILSEPKKK